MKKILTAAITSFALIQSVGAIPSNLGQSIIIDEAILDSPLITTSISQNEFIVDLKRITKDMDASDLIYEIKTVAAENSTPIEIEADSVSHHHRIHYKEIRYKVSLTLTPNPQIGPPVITILSIEQIPCVANAFFCQE